MEGNGGDKGREQGVGNEGLRDLGSLETKLAERCELGTMNGELNPEK